MKKIIVLLVTSVLLTGILIAAPKKSVDDWASEIESVANHINWSFKDQLKNAKNFNSDTFYSVFKSDGYVSVINPMEAKDNIPQFILLNPMNNITNDTFDKLSKGDVFMSYEGTGKNVTDFWIFTRKTVIANSVTGDFTKGFSVTSSAANTVMQYRGWGVNDGHTTTASSKGKGSFQGQTTYTDTCALYTLSKPEDGTFKIMILDTKNKNVTEYVLQYLGCSSSVKMIRDAQ